MIYILMALVCFTKPPIAQGANIIENSNVTLSQIVNDGQYNLDKVIRISNDSNGETADDFTKLYNKAADEDAYYDCCIEAFVNRCNRFVQDNRIYVGFRVPLWLKIDPNIFKEVWKTADMDGFNNFRSDGSEINIDPLYDSISLNEYLQKNYIIVSANMSYTMSEVIINLDAIIPFDGKYYKYKTSYFFNRVIDEAFYKKEYDTTNVKEIGKLIGTQIVKEPTSFICEDGELNNSFFFEKFITKYTGMGDSYIKRIDINIESDNTFKSLFLDTWRHMSDSK